MVSNYARIEGLIYVAGDTGISLDQLYSISGIDKKEIKKIVDTLNDYYHNDQDRAFEILTYNQNYQLVTKESLNNDLKKYFKDNDVSLLTHASLETLTIIAYRQPITRIEVDDVRGVNSSNTIQKLLRQRLIKTKGHKKTVGNPSLYVTTDLFLNLFGLKTIDDLPSIKENKGAKDNG